MGPGELDLRGTFGSEHGVCRRSSGLGIPHIPEQDPRPGGEDLRAALCCARQTLQERERSLVIVVLRRDQRQQGHVARAARSELDGLARHRACVLEIADGEPRQRLGVGHLRRELPRGPHCRSVLERRGEIAGREAQVDAGDPRLQALLGDRGIDPRDQRRDPLARGARQRCLAEQSRRQSGALALVDPLQGGRDRGGPPIGGRLDGRGRLREFDQVQDALGREADQDRH
ncbi:MAG: hypothetical protein OEY14_15650 [Myxococcales bacterium]|nr:hypothetical protein [Myxococcales bacterium]